MSDRGWYDIHGYDAHYQVNKAGMVRRIFKSCIHELHPFFHYKNGRKKMFVSMRKDGKKREVDMLKIMGTTFLGPVPEGYCYYHKDGMISNNNVSNIGIIKRTELGKLTGARSKSRPVAKIDSNGNVIELYSSSRQAGELNHMSYQAVLDRCHGRVKNPFKLIGFSFVFDSKIKY